MPDETTHLTDKESLTYHSLLFKKLEDIGQDTHYTREHIGKNSLTLAVVSLLAGIVLGMNFDMWKPIAVDIYHTADVINNLKGNK